LFRKRQNPLFPLAWQGGLQGGDSKILQGFWNPGSHLIPVACSRPPAENDANFLRGKYTKITKSGRFSQKKIEKKFDLYG
jgi:hypothetical protein